MKPIAASEENFRELLLLVARLRGPDGCPWDRAQTKPDIGRYLIEEAYEVLEALEGSPDHLREELGDLLFHILLLARMAEEAGEFTTADLLAEITAKMIRRHPHVFGDVTARRDEAAIKVTWARIKAEEKAARDARRPSEPAPSSLLAGVKAGQPALARALALQAKAATVGFDWNDPRAVLAKIREEADEIEAALDRGETAEIAAETGDLMFALVNLARHVGADPEATLRGTNAKFERRFAHIERALAQRGSRLDDATLDDMDRLWNEAKALEATDDAVASDPAEAAGR
jgi:ATP diphosphatase